MRRNKPLIQYRFKDRMNCVFFREFSTDREARLWYDRNKVTYQLKELSAVGMVYPHAVVSRIYASDY